MKKKRSKTKSIADLEALADQDVDTSQFFGPHKIASGMAMSKREMGDQIRRNIDYGSEMFLRLDAAANDLNVSVQAIAKLAIQEWLDRRDFVRIKSKDAQLSP